MAELAASPFDAMLAPRSVWAMRDAVVQKLATRGHSWSRQRTRSLSFLLDLCLKCLVMLILQLSLINGVDLTNRHLHITLPTCRSIPTTASFTGQR